MKDLCHGRIVSTVPASVTEHAQNAQINGFDCGLWTLCSVYTRALLRTVSKSKTQLIFNDMFLKTPHDALQFRWCCLPAVHRLPCAQICVVGATTGPLARGLIVGRML